MVNQIATFAGHNNNLNSLSQKTARFPWPSLNFNSFIYTKIIFFLVMKLSVNFLSILLGPCAPRPSTAWTSRAPPGLLTSTWS